ncbi:hypothetical protein B0T18DRAFT_220555 [Schizothecium vesticola]|uniref:Uncharacterized protein n=1 Tax=Schizothecium vesticola TaxID=314040 RepID=A0AA40EKD2_9PEZI|nr:hypothetical protein B0T18DRAFT_220555 [Schizothecium vesticola]
MAKSARPTVTTPQQCQWRTTKTTRWETNPPSSSTHGFYYPTVPTKTSDQRSPCPTDIPGSWAGPPSPNSRHQYVVSRPPTHHLSQRLRDIGLPLCISYVGTLVLDSAYPERLSVTTSPRESHTHTLMGAGRTSTDKIRLTSPGSQNHPRSVYTVSADPAVPRNGFLAPASLSIRILEGPISFLGLWLGLTLRHTRARKNSYIACLACGVSVRWRVCPENSDSIPRPPASQYITMPYLASGPIYTLA